jgi:FtsH-binding integral membrane protein
VASHFWLFAILEFVLVFATSIVGQNKDMALPGFILLKVFTFITGFTLAPILSFALAVNPNAIVYALVTTAATFVGMSLVPILFRVNVLGMGGFLFAGLIASGSKLTQSIFPFWCCSSCYIYSRYSAI